MFDGELTNQGDENYVTGGAGITCVGIYRSRFGRAGQRF